MNPIKRTLRHGLAILAILAAGLQAHEGHEEAGTFEPPNGGAFARLADHWVEFYLEDGKARLCMYEPDGQVTLDEHMPKQVTLKLSGKGVKPLTLKAADAVEGCAQWDFSSSAKLIRVQLSAIVDGKPAKARLNYENKAKAKAKAK
jgi:hypothetical protein